MPTAREYFAHKSWLMPWEIEARLERAVTGWPYSHPCDLCGADPHKPFMVKNELWRASDLPHKTLVCRECFEERIERSLTVYDLLDVPLSDWLFLELLNDGCDEEVSDGIPVALRTLIGTLPPGRATSVAELGVWERIVADARGRGKKTNPNRRRVASS